MMKNSDYWKKRFTVLENASHSYGQKTYSQIETAFMQAQKNIQGEIDKWYARFALNNGVTLTDAKKMLTSKELSELKWDVQQYIKHGGENAIDGRWAKQLENASARFHITRLEALQLRTQQAMEVAFGNQLDAVDKMARHILTEDYYHSIFEVQRGFNIGWDIGQIDEKKLEKLIVKPWAADGKNFSDRIWDQKQNMIGQLHQELTRTLIQGKAPTEAMKHLEQFVSGKFKNAKYAASRLVMTEQAYFHSVSQQEAFEELDVEEYEIIATLDSHTSAICQGMDGKHLPMKSYEAGVTAPPFHPNCRSVTAPYFEDNFGGMRAARGEDGKTYYVPDNTKYKDWKNKAVNGQDNDLTADEKGGTIKIKEDVKQNAEKLKVENFPSAFQTKAEAENTQAFVDYVNNLEGADSNVIALYNRMGKLENIEENGVKFKISHGKNCAVDTFYRNGKWTKTSLTIPKLQGDNLAGQVNTTLHEEMHLMDLFGRKDPQKPGEWFSTNRQSLVDMFKTPSVDMSDDIKKLFSEHDIKVNEVSSAIYEKYNAKISDLNDSMLNKTFQGTYKEYSEQYNELKRLAEYESDYECRNIMGGGIGNLQDIYDALSGGALRDSHVVKYGHGVKYYHKIQDRVCETVANYAALSVTRPDLIKLLRSDKPELVKELDELILDYLKKAGDKK